MYTYIYSCIHIYQLEVCGKISQAQAQLREADAGSSDNVAVLPLPRHSPSVVQPLAMDAATRVCVGVGGSRSGGALPLPAAGAAVSLVHEKSRNGLSEMLTELNLAEKYRDRLESEGVDIKDMKETLASRGDSALLQLLEEVGVDKVVHRHRIANHLSNLQRMSVERNW